jgi:D-ribose pyranase
LKKSGVLNHRLAEVIALMGHGDMLVVADAGLPVPPNVERIDLAVSAGIPGVVQVTEAVAGELQVERIVIATELESRDQDLARQFTSIFPGAQLESLTHTEFKRLTERARAIVRTGECTPYANIAIVSGVTY